MKAKYKIEIVGKRLNIYSLHDGGLIIGDNIQAVLCFDRACDDEYCEGDLYNFINEYLHDRFDNVMYASKSAKIVEPNSFSVQFIGDRKP